MKYLTWNNKIRLWQDSFQWTVFGSVNAFALFTVLIFRHVSFLVFFRGIVNNKTQVINLIDDAINELEEEEEEKKKNI